MPVYEYRCDACGEAFEVFVRSASQAQEASCPKCGSAEISKAVSRFGVRGVRRGSHAGAALRGKST